MIFEHLHCCSRVFTLHLYLWGGGSNWLTIVDSSESTLQEHALSPVVDHRLAHSALICWFRNFPAGRFRCVHPTRARLGVWQWFTGSKGVTRARGREPRWRLGGGRRLGCDTCSSCTCTCTACMKEVGGVPGALWGEEAVLRLCCEK